MDSTLSYQGGKGDNGMNTPTCLIVLLVIIIAVVGIILYRRRSAASAAKQITSSASSMASSATSAAKDTASGATSAVKDTASSAANTASSAASGAGSMVKDTAAGATSAATSAGGAMAGAAGAAAAAAGGMMDMGQMTDMLGGIMSGNMKLDANSPLGQMITPMADSITTKLGLPKEVGAMVVAFALSKIAEMMKSKAAGTGATAMPGGMNADEVLGKINSGAGVDAGSLKSMGLTSELAQKTGLSEEQAGKGLEMAMGELSAGLSGQTSYQGVTLPDMSMLKAMMK